ncbi:MICOS complex subunit MIC27-like isoform X3 [Chiloscyllium plagiosum]|uniref:MICOS complex subunit MIC27-like isoform X3 n=1 Tax=Chiloscyllium plagiosum TaxID=36176 RepID=UPI001CB7EA96|nr:MICOS complex subunit MIC27-like isoform X3 [Chiloscyllium plagiosum]
MASQVVRLSALPAALGMVSFKVYASSKSHQNKDSVKPEQLSVYTEPATNSTYITEQPGWLLRRIIVVRQAVEPFTAQCKGVYIAMKNGATNTIAFGKGSRAKKMVYPAGLATVGMAICYPQQAISVAKFSSQKMYAISQGSYEAVRSLWKRSVEKKKEDLETTNVKEDPLKHETLGKTESTDSPFEEELPQKPLQPKVTFVPTGEKRMTVLDPSLMDHGQSSPEDTDLYSTRN